MTSSKVSEKDRQDLEQFIAVESQKCNLRSTLTIPFITLIQ